MFSILLDGVSGYKVNYSYCIFSLCLGTHLINPSIYLCLIYSSRKGSGRLSIPLSFIRMFRYKS